MLGKVQVDALNLLQGPFKEVENYFLFVGAGTGTNDNKVIQVNTDTDLDAVLGSSDSVLKTQVTATALNAGQNWNACVLPLANGTSWEDAVDDAMESVSVEAIVLTDPVEDPTDVEALQAKAKAIMANHMRPLFFVGTTRPINTETEAWSDYSTAIKPLIDGIAADQVMIVPTLWADDQGTLCGRLCNQSVTVADSPMRVATGPLLGERSSKPVDKNGRAIDMAVLSDLEKARFSVPQWYPDYPGMYWADGNMLDVPAGDYQVVENVRVIQKAMRRVYPLCVGRIADRRLNSTPDSIASNKSYFMRPLREMAKSATIMGTVFPGEIHPPEPDSIVIQWPTKYSVRIFLKAQPYNCPKQITASLMLDLKNYAE
ncbi:MAG: DUF2586 domain-containing protein [Desulfovibrio sp.]